MRDTMDRKDALMSRGALRGSLEILATEGIGAVLTRLDYVAI